MVQSIEIEGIEFDINELYEMSHGLHFAWEHYLEEDLQFNKRKAKQIRDKLNKVIEELRRKEF